jgi:hypothetical protein
MKRITTAVLAGATVATLAFASASALTVDSKPLQAGSASVSCDTDGVDVTWGLETTPSYVGSVRIADISEDCARDGAKLFVAVNGTRVTGDAWVINATSKSFNLPANTSPESIQDVKVWIG